MSSAAITLILHGDYFTFLLEYIYTYYTCEERNEVCSVYTPKRHIQVYLLNNTSTLFVLWGSGLNFTVVPCVWQRMRNSCSVASCSTTSITLCRSYLKHLPRHVLWVLHNLTFRLTNGQTSLKERRIYCINCSRANPWVLVSLFLTMLQLLC
jgi:hypothetical protein